MIRERLALRVVNAAFAVAEKVAGWLEARGRKRALPRPLTVKDLLEIRARKDAERRSQAPTVLIPAPSERGKPGGGSSRY